MSVFDHRKPEETGKSGKITFPDTRKRTIIVGGGEYNPPTGNAGIRTKPQGLIVRFDPATGVQVSAESSELSVHPFFTPQNPTSITATATGSTTIDINGAISDPGNDGVEIHMSTTQGGPYSLETTVDESAFPVEISGLAASTTYYFVLRSFLYDGAKKDASFTAEVSATTGAGGAAPATSPTPTISEVSRTATTMTLQATWTDVGDETSYEWWAGSNNAIWSNGSQSAANSEPADTVSVQYTATRANADDGTFFCIRACNASGCAEQICSSFTVAGNLTAPTSLSATNPSASDVDLDWTDMAGASVADETAIERRLLGGSFTEIDTVPFGTTHYDDDALADGDYEYRVRHRDTGTGDTSPYSANDAVGINSAGGGSAYPNEPAGFVEFARQGWSNASVSSPAVESDFTNPEVGAGSVSTNKISRMEIVSDATGSPSGKVMRGKFPSGFGDGGSPWRFDLWGPSFSFGAGNQHDELYMSYWFQIEGSDFENQTTGTKVFYIAYGKTDRQNQFFQLLLGTFDDQAIQSGPLWVRQDLTFEYGGSDYNAERAISIGPWHHIEYYFKVNDDGVSNGILKMWVDGVLEHHVTDAVFLNSSAGATDGFYHLQFTPVWGGNSGDVRTRDDFFRVGEVYLSAP